MTFLATQPKEQREQAQVLASTPSDPEAFAPGFFSGSGDATRMGIGRVAATGLQIVNEAGGFFGRLATVPIDELFDTDLTGFMETEMVGRSREITASMTPDPYTTGTAGQILYGLVGVGAPALVGYATGGPLGAAALGGGFTGIGTYTDLTQDGVDPGTAARVASLDAVLAGAGVGLPAAISGKVALNTLLYGPGIGVSQNLIQGQGASAILEARGYDELADRYAEIDAELIAADAILGGAFGWVGARSNARVSRETAIPQEGIDAAHAALDRRHADLDTAPGIPADIAAARSHARNLAGATEAMLDGRPFEAEPLKGAFVPKPVDPSLNDGAILRALKESGYDEMAAEIGMLEAEMAKRGIPIVDEALPDLAAAADRLEQSGARVGRVTDVKIGDEYATARWAVMEADEVAPAVKVSENQLRDRTRAASEMQVNEIAAKLDPRLLLVDAPTMDVGAPTLTADGKVIAGNGRALAVRKAYAGERGQAYREALVEAAERFGVDPGAIEGMNKPVLVRVLQQAVDVERAAILSNEGGAMRMSGLEQARVDAGRLPGLAEVTLPESGDFTAASMRNFVRGWVQQYPATQRAALLDAAGQLSQEGMNRIRNAMLFRAYGDSPVLQRLVESSDPGARNVAQALVKAAPRIADVKEAIDRGDLHDMDIADDIVRTADLVEQIRDQGQTVDGWLGQLDMFNPGESPATLAMLRFIDANKRSPNKIADMLTGYYDRVVDAGNPGQGDMLGGQAPDSAVLLSNAIAEASPDKAAAIVQDTLFAPKKAPESVRPEAVARNAAREVDAWGMPEPVRTIPDNDPLLQPRDKDMSPEREAMREAMIDERFKGKVPAKGKPIAIVMGGGGASGKGTILARLKALGVVPKGAVELDPDAFKTGKPKQGWSGIPEYRQIVDAGDMRAAAVVHEESSMIFDRARARAVAGKYHVVLDRTLGDPAKGMAELQALKDAGYEVQLIGVSVSPMEAIRRAVLRANGPDLRYVPINVLLKAHRGFARAWEQYAAIADRAVLYDNEVPQGTLAKPIAGWDLDRKALTVLDDKAYTGFARKGGLNEKAQSEADLYRSARSAEAEGVGSAGRDDAGASGPGRPGLRGRAERPVGAPESADAVSGPRRGGLDPAEILAERPDLKIVPDDGAPAYAADTLVAADVAVRRAQNDAMGFDAAVNCFLRSAA